MARRKNTKRRVTPVDAEVGARIKEFRLLEGWSQTELGDECGISFQQIQKYERGDNRISAGRLSLVAQVFGRPITDFFEADVPPYNGKAERGLLELVRCYRQLKPHHRTTVRNMVRAWVEA